MRNPTNRPHLRCVYLNFKDSKMDDSPESPKRLYNRRSSLVPDDSQQLPREPQQSPNSLEIAVASSLSATAAEFRPMATMTVTVTATMAAATATATTTSFPLELVSDPRQRRPRKRSGASRRKQRRRAARFRDGSRKDKAVRRCTYCEKCGMDDAMSLSHILRNPCSNVIMCPMLLRSL